MAALLKQVEDFIWDERFWFNGTTWKDLESTDPNVYYPKLSDIVLPSFLLGIVFLGVRYVYERLIVFPLGRSFGLKERKVYVAPIPALESLYAVRKGKLSKLDIKQAKKQTDLSEKEIQRWLYKRKLKSVPSALSRFAEQRFMKGVGFCIPTKPSWHFTFYLSAFVYGLALLWNKSWMSDTNNCWKGWPKLHVSDDMYYYYLVELGFYWGLLFTLVHDEKRKDFWQMVTHHITTMSLMYFSWVCNFVRVGTLVLIVHDASDHWCAGAKMAKLCKRQALCEVLFFMFFLVWVICRLIIYPVWVLNTTFNEVFDHLPVGYSFWLFNGLLFVLQLLHIIWTYFIVSVVVMKFTQGKIVRDTRSDTSGLEDTGNTDESEEEEDLHKPFQNGLTKRPAAQNKNCTK